MHSIVNYFKNCWKFKKELSKYHDFDYMYSLIMFRKSLEILYAGIDPKSLRESTNTKLSDLNKMINCLDRLINDNYSYLAEEELELKSQFSLSEYKSIIINDKTFYEIKNEISEELEETNKKIYKLSEELRNSDIEYITECFKFKMYEWWD